jgi:hypothetical protein
MKRTAGSQPQTKIQKRVSRISTPDLVTWSENALFVVGRELTGYLRTHDKALLEEANMGAEALHAITQELIKRTQYD